MKVLIADDHALVRQALRQLLADPALGLVNGERALSFTEADGFDAALEVLAASGADLLLIDLSMPGMAGAASLRALREAHPATKIVVVAGWEDRATMLECLSAGVHGYVLKSFATDQIVRAIEVILAGRRLCPARDRQCQRRGSGPRKRRREGAGGAPAHHIRPRALHQTPAGRAQTPRRGAFDQGDRAGAQR